jgi:hypothetical protein
MTCTAACIILAGAVATIGSKPYVELTATQHGYAVTFHNARIAQTPQPQVFVVDLHGIAVTVHVASQSGDDPDDMIVFPPVGYYCDPCQVRAGENQSATVELLPEVGV